MGRAPTPKPTAGTERQHVHGDGSMCVGTAACVWGQRHMFTGQWAFALRWWRVCRGMAGKCTGTAGKCTRMAGTCMGTACVCMGMAGVCARGSPGMHRDGRCVHGTAGTCTGTAVVGMGTASRCKGTASLCTGTAWDMVDVCTVAMSGAAAMGAGQEECPHPNGVRCCSPGATLGDVGGSGKRAWFLLLAQGDGTHPT